MSDALPSRHVFGFGQLFVQRGDQWESVADVAAFQIEQTDAAIELPGPAFERGEFTVTMTLTRPRAAKGYRRHVRRAKAGLH